MAVTTMELMELLRKVDGGDIDFLREGYVCSPGR
jgi:hypothetical protein